MASLEKFEDHCWRDVIPEQDLRLAFYSACARETSVGPSPALLAIDLYNSVYRGGARMPHEIDEEALLTCGIFAHRAIEPTKRLFAAARAARIPIFYAVVDQRPNKGPSGASATKRGSNTTARPDDYVIYSEFTPQPEDVVIYKQRASAFQGTPIVSHLTLLGVRSLILCGEATSGCLRASVVDAYSSGYHVSVAEECAYDRAELTHKVNLFDMHHKYADVMSIEDIETQLRRLG